jgi:hypothetical protein
MSTTIWDESDTNTLALPFVPAGTIAALATTWPFQEFNVDTNGSRPPVGNMVRYPRYPAGTVVTFSM